MLQKQLLLKVPSPVTNIKSTIRLTAMKNVSYIC